MKAEGPGQRFGVEVEEQSEAQRQLPAVQAGLVQHFIEDGSLGQAPAMEVPPEEVQSAAEMQTPGEEVRWMGGTIGERRRTSNIVGADAGFIYCCACKCS